MEPLAWLLYGMYGSGKSPTAVSAFWDWKRKKQIRDGRWLLFGREENLALGVPEELKRRFTSPAGNPLKFVEEFEVYMKAAIAQARKGGPEVYVFDGFTEWNALFLWEHQQAKGDADYWDKWRAAKDRFFQFMQFIHPAELKAHVIGTARVDEKRRGTKSKRGADIPGDPDYIEFKHIPAIAGWARLNLGNYFGVVGYMESVPGRIVLPDGRSVRGAEHRLYLVPSEDTNAMTKNWWEFEWMMAGKPEYLSNPTFDEIVEEIEDAQRKSLAAIQELDAGRKT